MVAGQVIWALGWCMVVLGGLIYLPTVLLGLIGVLLVAGHNLLDPIGVERWGGAGWLWKVLHKQAMIEIAPGHSFFVIYPLLPWIGVMALGYLFGRVWPALSRGRLVAMGTAMVGLFLILRTSVHYGDPRQFAVLGGERTIFSLLDCEKYPPSLDYVLMTLGPSLILLGVWRGRPLDGLVGRVLVTYGRAPLFFYMLHLPLVHAMTIPIRALRGLPLITGAFRHGLDIPLMAVYGLWLLALLLLWEPTRRWAALKAHNRSWWLSYL
jgi:uncharacterized membrane protein